MRAVIYVRVSTEEQVSGTSLDSQEKACYDYAMSKGMEVKNGDVFREEGVSAKIINRPELSNMIEYCARSKGKITHCVIWKVDRLARQSHYHHVIKAKLAALGVKLVSVTEPIGDGPMGNLMDGMLAAFAQFDNDVRTARTTGGMRARTMQGGWPHAAPYGLKGARTPSGITTVAPNEDTPRLVKFLTEFSTGAYTVRQAADIAYELGMRGKNGNKMTWQTVKNIIINPLYAGFVQSKYTEGDMIKGVHEPIISEKIYYRNISILKGNVHHKSREAVEDWPLRGGFLLHTCKKPMTGSSPRGRNGPSPRYSCMECRAKVIGRSTSKRRELVHDDFLELLNKVRPKAGAAKLFKEIVIRQWNEEFKSAVKLSETLDGEIASLQKKKSRVIDLFIDSKISDEDKEMKLKEIQAEQAQIELRRIDAKEYVNDKEKIIDGALVFMTNPGKFWNQSGLEVRKRVQDIIFPDGLIYDCEDGFRTAKLSESYLLITKITPKGDLNPTVVAATGIEPVTLGL
jgi:site-specific DNA recombinase